MKIKSMSISRQEIEALPPDVIILKEKINSLARDAARTNEVHLLDLTIGGYDFDPRELYEIAEVCNWARKAFEEIASIWFFLTADCQIRFTGWLCGPFKKEDVYTNSFQQLFDEKSVEIVASGLIRGAEMLKRAGASERLINAYRQYHENPQSL